VSPGEHSLGLFWGDPLSPLQEAQDPGLEICFGCGGPGQLERSDLSMPIGNSRCHETMQVRLPIRKISVGVDRQSDAGFQVLGMDSLIDGPVAVEPADRLDGAASHISEQGAVVEEVEAQPFWHRKDPLVVTDRQEQLVNDPLGPEGGSLGLARGAKTSGFAGKTDEQLPAALRTPKPRKAQCRHTAVQKGQQGLLDLRTPETMGSGEAVIVDLLELLEVVFDKPVER